jgi:hypothetical protein
MAPSFNGSSLQTWTLHVTDFRPARQSRAGLKTAAILVEARLPRAGQSLEPVLNQNHSSYLTLS